MTDTTVKRSQLAETHTLAVLVENKAGVLARVAGLFARRGFNIESLAVAPTDAARDGAGTARCGRRTQGRRG